MSRLAEKLANHRNLKIWLMYHQQPEENVWNLDDVRFKG